MEQPYKDLFQPPCPLFHIAVNGLQRLLLGHDHLQRFICRDTRQDLAFQMPLLFRGSIGVFPAQLR